MRLQSFENRDVWAERRGRQVVRELERFAPTHVLLRSGGVIAQHVLQYCTSRSLSTLVIFANRFERSGLRNRLLTTRLVRMLNLPCVTLVGNHKQPATDSMLECGVEPGKVVAWDWPNARDPKDWPVKTLRVGEEYRIVYVGSVSVAKGVGDLVEAIQILCRTGKHVRLTLIGDGPDFVTLKARAAKLPAGVAKFLGRVSNEEAFQWMLQATVVCVPSRHEFTGACLYP